jgi:hypothetical protein
VQQLVERGGVDARDRLLLVDQALRAPCRRRCLQRGLGGALAVAASAASQSLPRSTGELDVLHVAVVALEPLDAPSSSSPKASGIASSSEGARHGFARPR